MKRFIITITLLVLLIGSAFATNWKMYETHKNENGGCEIYFDYDATEPFELEKENIRYIMNLQFYYSDLEIAWITYYDDEIYAKGAKHNCYSTLLLFEDGVFEYHVNNDGTVTVYTYKHDGDTIEDIMRKLSGDIFEKPWVRTEKEEE